MDFLTTIERVLGHEGRYVNNPADPGGETKWGITWPVLREAIALKLVPPETTIASLERDQAITVYNFRFWMRINASKLFDGVAYQLLDFAVNSGIENAVRKFQLALGVSDDGHWGPVSQAAADAMSESDQIMRLNGVRLDWLTYRSNWPDASRGWSRRIAKNLMYGSDDS